MKKYIATMSGIFEYAWDLDDQDAVWAFADGDVRGRIIDKSSIIAQSDSLEDLIDGSGRETLKHESELKGSAGAKCQNCVYYKEGHCYHSWFEGVERESSSACENFVEKEGKL